MLIDKNKRHQSGIALITTIILTGIMLTSVVLVSKEMIDEAKNSTRIDNSLIAYYAAEAGLEDALLEFRYDHEAEISKENDTNPSVDVTKTANNTPRVMNLGTNSIDYTTRNFTKSYYELVMWNKTPQILDQKILQDDTYEFSLDNINNIVTLRWANNPETPAGNGYRVEVTVYDKNGELIDAVKKFYCTRDDNRNQPFFKSDLYSEGVPGKRIFRIKPWYTKNSTDDCSLNSPPGGVGLNPDGTIPGSSAENKIPYIVLSINKSPTTDLVASTIANIESVGYYGGVARKITATIDRTSGNILSIFDYVIYSGSNLIK